MMILNVNFSTVGGGSTKKGSANSSVVFAAGGPANGVSTDTATTSGVNVQKLTSNMKRTDLG